MVSDPTIINPRATTCPRRTSVDVVKSYDENGDDNDEVDARGGGCGVKSNNKAFIIQSEKPKANQNKKQKPKATKPKAGSKRAKVFTDRTNVDHPLPSLARSSSKNPNAKASSKLNAKVSFAIPKNADNAGRGMSSFSNQLAPQNWEEEGKYHPVLVYIWKLWLNFIPVFDGEQTVDGSEF